MDSKRRKVDTENRLFKVEWTEDFFFVLPERKDAKPTCLICSETVAVNKVANLKRHYESKHAGKYDTDFPKGSALRTDKIRTLKLAQERSVLILKRSMSEQERCAEASLRISWVLAKHMAPFSHAEIVKECLIEAADALFSDLKDKKDIPTLFSKIPLSNDTATRRIKISAGEVFESLMNELKNVSIFALALDESTDIKDVAQMAVYVRYPYKDTTFKEELLTLLPLHDHTTGQKLFEAFSTFFDKFKLSYSKIVSVSTDGAPAMVGSSNGFVAYLKEKNPDILAFHCIIHQSVLCGKLSGEFKKIMNMIMKIINYLHSHSALQHRLLRAYLDENDAEFSDLLLHNDVRWLSKGKVLNRFLRVFDEICDFLQTKSSATASAHLTFLHETSNRAKICFLADIFSHFNELNVALQGKDKLLPDMWEKVKAFKRKLALFELDLRSKELVHFPNLKCHEGELSDS